MGLTIQFESHRVELPLVYEMEHDPDVLEYYDQPPSIPLAYQAATEDVFRSCTPRTTSSSAKTLRGGWNAKPQGISKLWPSGRQTATVATAAEPGEVHSSALGLDYRVWSSAEINWILQRNLQFLEDYLRCDPASTAGFVASDIKVAIDAKPGISLLELLETVCGVSKTDEIYLLIATGGVYVDLSAAAIVEPEHVRVFANAETAGAYERACPEAGKSVVRGGVGAGSDEMPAVHGKAFQLLAAASEQDLIEANRRFDFVTRYLGGEKEPDAIPARTLRFWIAQYRVAKEKYGNGYVGLRKRKPAVRSGS
jgi:hypothetical protein